MPHPTRASSSPYISTLSAARRPSSGSGNTTTAPRLLPENTTAAPPFPPQPRASDLPAATPGLPSLAASPDPPRLGVINPRSSPAEPTTRPSPSHSRFASISLLRSRKRASQNSLSQGLPVAIDTRSSKAEPDAPHAPISVSDRTVDSDSRLSSTPAPPPVLLSRESLPPRGHARTLSSTTLSGSTSTLPTSSGPAAQDLSEEEGIERVDSIATLSDNTSTPGPWTDILGKQRRKMHQTSSRLLRMTDDDRPFTRDFKDLFSTLMVSLPLTPHRVRFSKVEHTFTTEEAITNLGSLKFSQSNRMPDPKDPSRIVTTTTTTTFSMAKEMARSVCTKFFEARFIESLDGKTDFTSKSSVWQLTPKGMRILARFCQRNGIHQRHVNEVLDSPRNMMQLVILERESETDKINHDKATVEVIFRRFVGETGPNLKPNASGSDTDSLNEYATGLVGVRMVRVRGRSDKENPYVFTGKAAVDWLMDCCTTVDKRETFEMATLFIQHGLITPAIEERYPNGQPHRFQATKTTQYAVTERGMRVAGWVRSPNGSVNGEATTANKAPAGVARDSNTNRMTIIIRDPALRLLFREFLGETHCEENLAFYLDVTAFLRDYEHAKRAVPLRLDLVRETLAAAYSLYNAFLAPGSPCELNIDHNLRNALAGRMTRAVGEDEEMVNSLDEVAVLFDQAQNSVFKLMASDSVPKFARDPKYATILRDRNLEHLLTSFAGTSIS